MASHLAVIPAERPRRIPRRVLLLNYEYPPLGGGAGVATAALARRLAAGGVVTDVVTSGLLNETALHADDAVELLEITRVRSRRRGVHQAGMLGAGSYIAGAAPIVRRLTATRQYDLVHCFFSLPTGFLLPLLSHRLPVVVSLRGSDVPHYDPSNRALTVAHRVLEPVTRRIWRRADRVVAVCDSLGRLARRTDPTLQYEVIPNGVDAELFHPALTRDRAGCPVQVIAVARLIKRKGLDTLLRAWALLDRGLFKLEIVGHGAEHAALHALAAELGVAPDVSFVGALGRAGLAERYRNADLFTLVPYAEAFGNTFAEALASGLPIVASDVGGIPDLVRAGENGILVAPGDPPATAAAVRQLASNAGLRAWIAQQNRRRAETVLSWDASTARYLALYNELLSPHSLRVAEDIPGAVS
jgi:glycogen(starch) synthase